MTIIARVQPLVIASLFSLLASTQVHAQGVPVEWLLQVGADFGGSKLGSVQFTNGDSVNVRANDGIFVGVGAAVSNGADTPFKTQLSIGFKFGGPTAENGDVTWSAIPVDVLEFYQFASVKIGGGINYQLNPTLDVDVPGAKFVDKFKNALGYVVQIGWEPNQVYSVDLRYTAISYRPVAAPSATIGGNVGGIYVAYRF